jgi:hypothetical protein
MNQKWLIYASAPTDRIGLGIFPAAMNVEDTPLKQSRVKLMGACDGVEETPTPSALRPRPCTGWSNRCFRQRPQWS